MARPTVNPMLPSLWMLSGSVAFSLMAALAHVLGGACDWRIIAFSRAGLACLFGIVLARAAGAQLHVWGPRMLWLRSTAGSISLVCTFYSLTRLSIPVSEVLTLTNIFPVWVAVLSWPVLGEVPPMGVWVSVAFGVAGVFLIQQPQFAQGNYGALIPVGASLATAVAMMGLHQLHGIHPSAIVAHFSGVAAVFCLVALAVGGRMDRDFAHLLDARTLLILVSVGASATVGQLLMTKAFAMGAPTQVAVVGLTQIVFSLAIDMYMFDVTIDARKVIGMLLILGPTAWMMLRGVTGPPALEDV